MTEAGVPAERLGAGAPTLGSPEQIGALPEPVHTAVITGFADALQTTFLAAVPFALVGFLVLLFLREAPLRRDTREHSTAQVVAEGFETAVVPDSDLRRGTDDVALPPHPDPHGTAGTRPPKAQP